MVVFTCSHCGESLQKPKVEKHYFTVCKKASKALTCVDCFKDFLNEDYVLHTKCVTEEERYAPKGAFASPIVKKGDAKQESWTTLIQSVVVDSPKDNPNHQKIFDIMSSAANVPRKKSKFINFIKSASGNKINFQDIEGVWGIIDGRKAELKKDSADSTEGAENKEESANLADSINGDKKKKKKKKSKSLDESKETNGQVEVAAVNGGIEGSSKKKRKQSENENGNTQEPEVVTNGTTVENTKKKRKSKGLEVGNENGDTEVAKKAKLENNDESPKIKGKKRKSKDAATENAEQTTDDQKKLKLNISNEESETNKSVSDESFSNFDYKEKVLEILGAKKSMSSKKLEKKVLGAYQKTTGTEPTEKQIKKFQKKLKKMSEIEISEDNVKLVVT